MRSFLLLSALILASSAQDVTTAPPAVETPDALPVEDLKTLPNPDFTIIPGLLSQTVNVNLEATISSASSEVQETPLSVFPAQTNDAQNAAGESPAQETPSPARRDAKVEFFNERAAAACAPEATISNVHSIDVSSHAAFKADSKIAAVANAAAAPAGYFQSFKNLAGATSASAYLGYSLLSTGYDVAECAKRCTAKQGCLAFNVFFERAPSVSPGSGCEDPVAAANVKCSLWGVPLDESTASNNGQWRAKFQVGIGGSNGYTSYSVGGPVENFGQGLKLNNAAMNAPLRDCAGTWTYLGYKIYQNVPFDPRLCSAACDAQTEFNVAHPPSTGKPVRCGAFGAYLVYKENSAGKFVTGQMCTMYTSGHDAKYAVNTGRTDANGTKWTYSSSFWYTRNDRQPICSSSIDYLKSEAQDFCSSFISYSAPQTTVATTVTPDMKAVVTETVLTTLTNDGDVVSVPGDVHWRFRRQVAETTADAVIESGIATDAAPSILTIDSTFGTVADLGPSTAAILAETMVPVVPTNGSQLLERRAVPTPTSIAGWDAAKISEACVQVATGIYTVTNTATGAPVTTSTITTTTTATTTTWTALSTCIVPSVVPEYKKFTPIWGIWDNERNAPGPNPGVVSGAVKVIQLPFETCLYGECTDVLHVYTDGIIYYPTKNGREVIMEIYADTIQYLYQGWGLGTFWRVTGPIGQRVFTISWYSSTYHWGHAVSHFTASFYEDRAKTVVYKYYDAVQVFANRHTISTTKWGRQSLIEAWPSGQFMASGTQIRIDTSSSDPYDTVVNASQRDRVECCTIQGFHSCTEFQPQVL